MVVTCQGKVRELRTKVGIVSGNNLLIDMRLAMRYLILNFYIDNSFQFCCTLISWFSISVMPVDRQMLVYFFFCV